MTAQPTTSELLSMIANMKATNDALMAKLADAQKPRAITLKVTTKKPDGSGTEGAISIYGLGRFPVTLYRSQWERLLSNADTVKAFIKTNEHLLASK